jgi:hypothetical protein
MYVTSYIKFDDFLFCFYEFKDDYPYRVAFLFVEHKDF